MLEGETMNYRRRFPLQRGLPAIAVPAILLLATLLLTIPAGADTVAAISAGPAKVCPDPGCTCMPEGQAGSLGYVRCSVNETPCFRDSFGRSLYCFRAPSSATCAATDCNGSDGQPGSSAGNIRLVITMQVSPQGTVTCEEAEGDACALPVAESTPAAAATDPFGNILAFFRSLFGMQ